MKRSIFLKLHTILMVLILIFQVSRAQSVTLGNIERAMKGGDVDGLSGYFGSSVDITINQNQSTYSNTQAQMVLRRFFSKNAVRSFDFTHTGNSQTNNIIFCVGSLTTTTGTFKVYMYLKQQPDNGSVLREIKIQK